MATAPQDPESGNEPPATTSPVESSEWLTDHLVRVVDAHSANDEEGTMAALAVLCSAARNAALPIEGVLVPLKQLWQARTASRTPLRTGPTEDRLARLVSACIDVYYRQS